MLMGHAPRFLVQLQPAAGAHQHQDCHVHQPSLEKHWLALHVAQVAADSALQCHCCKVAHPVLQSWQLCLSQISTERE